MEEILKLPYYQIGEAMVLGAVFYLLKKLIQAYNPKWNNLINFVEYIFISIIAFEVLFRTLLDIDLPPLMKVATTFWVFWKALFNGAEKVHFFNKKTAYKAYNGKIILKNEKTIDAEILIEK